MSIDYDVSPQDVLSREPSDSSKPESPPPYVMLTSTEPDSSEEEDEWLQETAPLMPDDHKK
jgi:hypothetical protein